jgi:hypothetical protein
MARNIVMLRDPFWNTCWMLDFLYSYEPGIIMVFIRDHTDLVTAYDFVFCARSLT